MKKLLLLTPLLLGAATASVQASEAWQVESISSPEGETGIVTLDVAAMAQSENWSSQERQTLVDADSEGTDATPDGEQPKAKQPEGLRVAFHVTGMKKTKSGAT